MKKLLWLIIISASLLGIYSSCSFNSGLRELRIVYAPQHMNINVPASCSIFVFELMDIKRKRVTNINLLQNVGQEISGLKKDTNHDLSTKSVDVRIRCFLDYQEKTDTLCLGEFNGVLLNGELMEDNPALLELLKSNIYKEQE